MDFKRKRFFIWLLCGLSWAEVVNNNFLANTILITKVSNKAYFSFSSSAFVSTLKQIDRTQQNKQDTNIIQAVRVNIAENSLYGESGFNNFRCKEASVDVTNVFIWQYNGNDLLEITIASEHSVLQVPKQFQSK